MWETTQLEKITEKQLKKECGSASGSELYSSYVTARKKLVDDILPEIKARQPHLTDHGSDHIKNVLNNSDKLLGKNINKISGMDLYCLLVSIIFHDAGNILDRDEHQSNISEIYDFARPGNGNKHEKRIILKTVMAHCGHAPDGSKDTLKSFGRKCKFKRQTCKFAANRSCAQICG